MSPKSAKGRLKGILYFHLILLKNEPQIGRRPIKRDIKFLFYFIEKWAPNRPKADKKGYYIYYLILLKNEAQIGRRPIKGDIIFLILFCWKMSPKSAEGR